MQLYFYIGAADCFGLDFLGRRVTKQMGVFRKETPHFLYKNTQKNF